MNQREIEEILELIWTLREEKISERKMVHDITQEKEPEKILNSMRENDLVRFSNGDVFLTENGEKYAEKIIRRHRLAERLFKDVFKMDDSGFEREACTWEHVLSEEATDSVCAFLGHPRVCPHNKPIPRGECCNKYEKTVSPLVHPMSEIGVGRSVKIVYILPSLQKRLERLTNLGIIPGNVIRIKQKHPAMVVVCDQTTIALDKEVASEIYVIAVNDKKS